MMTDTTENDGGEAAPLAQAMCEGQENADVFALVRQTRMDDALEVLSKSQHVGRWKEVDGEGHSLLHWGALSGSLPFMRAGLDPKNGALGLVDTPAPNGQTPFMWATINGHVAIMRLLLEAGANTRAKDSFGATPLSLAVQHDRPAAVLLLMSRGPREKMLTDSDSNGCTALHWAAYKGNLNILKLLDYFEASFSILDGDSKTVLHRAVQGSQACVLQFLIEKEVDPSKRDKDNNTCMDLAMQQKNGYIHRVLERYVDVEGRDVPPTPTEGNVIVDGDVDEEAGQGTRLKKKKKEKDDVRDMKTKAMQNAAPTFWLVCVSLSLFQFLTDLRATSMIVCPVPAVLFQLGVPLSMALFFYVATADPGKIPARIKHASGVEEVMRKIDTDDCVNAAKEVKRLCTTTWILKGPRTKYCKNTEACVEEFDHFCGWLNCAIGKGNHRPFIFLALAELSTQCCHWWLCVQVVLELVKFESVVSFISQVLTGYPMTALVIMIHTFTAPGIMMLLLHQLRLVVVNLTTNEMINAPKYDHFWLIRDNGTKVFRNPFNKGTVVLNCMDFWWTRRRGELGPVHVDRASACDKGCCHDHAPKTKLGKEYEGTEMV